MESVSDARPSDETEDKKKLNCFVLETTDGTIHMGAESGDERDSWVKAINDAIVPLKQA